MMPYELLRVVCITESAMQVAFQFKGEGLVYSSGPTSILYSLAPVQSHFVTPCSYASSSISMLSTAVQSHTHPLEFLEFSLDLISSIVKYLPVLGMSMHFAFEVALFPILLVEIAMIVPQGSCPVAMCQSLFSPVGLNRTPCWYDDPRQNGHCCWRRYEYRERLSRI